MTTRKRTAMLLLVLGCYLCISCNAWGYGASEWPQSLKMADFILSLQNSYGAIPDAAGSGTVNQDSNMEYALLGLAAAYSATGNAKYLNGLESGIAWLAARQEMSDPFWKGSWYYVYADTPPFNHIPTSPGPGITDVRGVDTTCTLFAYLLYLDHRLNPSSTLYTTYAANAQAGLDFAINHSSDTDGLTWSSYQLFSSDNQWHLYKFKYTNDQADDYLGFHAGELLYNASKYGPVASNLQTKVPQVMFSTSLQRYGLGIDQFGTLDTSLDGYSESMEQGYLAWMWGNTPQNQAGMAWLRSKVRSSGAVITQTVAYSLNVAFLGMGDNGMAAPEPLSSFNWLIANTYDPRTGGVKDSNLSTGTSETNNVAGFSAISLLGFSPFAAANYQNNITAAGNWTVSSASSLPDGAILYTSTQIKPYYANLAAIGLTKNSLYYPQVKSWMQWYLSHLNYPDKWGLYCTMYDYNVSGTTETSTNDADSTDSYAATFVSLAWAYWQTGDANAQAYIKTLKYQLDCIGGVMVQTQQSNGLTWAKPSYKVQYLMDNSEVYKGLRDLAKLFQYAFNDSNGSAWYNSYGDKAFQGIQTVLWDSAHNSYFPYAGSPQANWGTWYPDATAQLFPILNGVLAPSDPRAQQLYATFNSSWPNWTSLGFPDQFPWVLVSGAAALMGDTTRVNSYINTIQNKYVNTGFPYPWYCAESGWFIRVNNYMLGAGGAL